MLGRAMIVVYLVGLVSAFLGFEVFTIHLKREIERKRSGKL